MRIRKNLHHLTSTTVVLICVAALASQAIAQTVPASSADSGRRAIVAVDQANIYNNINSAWQTGVNAWNYADAAYNTAVSANNSAANAYNSATNAYNLGADAWNRANIAQGTADAAYGRADAAFGRGGGFATQVFTAYDGGDMISQVACVYGSYGPASGRVPVHQATGWVFQPYSCPSGSTTYVFSRGTLPPDADTGGDGGGGGGGGGG